MKSKTVCRLCNVHYNIDFVLVCAEQLRYHGRWILPKNAKNIFFAVRIE